LGVARENANRIFPGGGSTEVDVRVAGWGADEAGV